jgi:hypothetical protein
MEIKVGPRGGTYTLVHKMKGGVRTIVKKYLSQAGAPGSRVSTIDTYHRRSPDAIQDIKNKLLNMYLQEKLKHFIIVDGLGKENYYMVHNVRKESHVHDTTNKKDHIEITFSVSNKPTEKQYILIADKDFADDRVTSFERDYFILDLSVKGLKSTLLRVGGNKKTVYMLAFNDKVS